MWRLQGHGKGGSEFPMRRQSKRNDILEEATGHAAAL